MLHSPVVSRGEFVERLPEVVEGHPRVRVGLPHRHRLAQQRETHRGRSRGGRFLRDEWPRQLTEELLQQHRNAVRVLGREGIKVISNLKSQCHAIFLQFKFGAPSSCQCRLAELACNSENNNNKPQLSVWCKSTLLNHQTWVSSSYSLTPDWRASCWRPPGGRVV